MMKWEPKQWDNPADFMANVSKITPFDDYWRKIKYFWNNLLENKENKK